MTVRQARGTIPFFLFFFALMGLPLTVLWAQDSQVLASPNLPAQETFGFAVANGDLDGDGDFDLLVGAPLADAPDPNNPPPATIQDAGQVYVYTASPADDPCASGVGPNFSLNLAGTPVLYQGLGSTQDPPVQFARFGWSIAVVDADNDGKPDLLIGAPFTNLGGGNFEAGEVVVFKNVTSPFGNNPGPITFIFSNRITRPLPAGNQAYAHFGWSVEGRRITPSPSMERFVIGAPDADSDLLTDKGEVWERIASCTPGVGCTFTWRRHASPNPDASENFGAALLAYDMESLCPGSGCPTADPCMEELFIGIPGDQEFYGGNLVRGGAVLFVQGDTRTFIREPDQNGLSGPEEGALFGHSLGVVEVEDGGHCGIPGEAALIVGAPNATYDCTSTPNAGEVYFFWLEDAPLWQCGEVALYLSWVPSSGDRLGWSVAGGDSDADGAGNGSIFAGAPGAFGRQGRVLNFEAPIDGFSTSCYLETCLTCQNPFPAHFLDLGPPRWPLADPCPPPGGEGIEFGRAVTAVRHTLQGNCPQACAACVPPTQAMFRPCEWAVGAPFHPMADCQNYIPGALQGHVGAYNY